MELLLELFSGKMHKDIFTGTLTFLFTWQRVMADKISALQKHVTTFPSQEIKDMIYENESYMLALVLDWL